LGIDRWEKWEWDLSFRWEWEWDGNENEVIEMGGIWYTNLFPNTSSHSLLNRTLFAIESILIFA